MIIEALIILFFVLLFILPGFTLVRDDEVGIMTKKMLGSSLPQGQIIATKGKVGVQADILMPGLYWRIPVILKIERAKVTMIRSGFLRGLQGS
ncbi:MAG: hypothetical protein WC620_01725 [Methanoregula sp.]|jgi:uncharacterized membrane protein YqiK